MLPAATATAPEPSAPPAEDDAAPWPEGATAVVVDRAESADEAVPAQASSRPEGPLPPLETLVARIPANVREALDDLFRVKFVGVQRLPESALHGPDGSGR